MVSVITKNNVNYIELAPGAYGDPAKPVEGEWTVIFWKKHDYIKAEVYDTESNCVEVMLAGTFDELVNDVNKVYFN